jgi:chromosome segregation ATPase
MLTGSELQTAITAILVAAVCVGFLLHSLWSYLSWSRTSESARTGEMAERLHEAEMAREAAEIARDRAEMLLGQREAEMADRLAAVQASATGAGERETALSRELDDAWDELEAMDDDLGHARQRIAELEAEIAALRGDEE